MPVAYFSLPVCVAASQFYKINECVSKLKSVLLFVSFLDTDYAENTDFTNFLYSFFVKSVFSA